MSHKVTPVIIEPLDPALTPVVRAWGKLTDVLRERILELVGGSGGSVTGQVQQGEPGGGR
jgi:hypothetical protein